MHTVSIADESLNELYQAIILDHHKRPHNCKVLEGCTCQAQVFS